MDLLSTYLTSSAVAPLNKEYIETESPLWYDFLLVTNVHTTNFFSSSTYIYFAEEVRANKVDLPIYIGSVPTELLEGFDQKLKTSLKRIVSEGIDMERMAMIINRDERQVRGRHLIINNPISITSAVLIPP